MINRIIKFVLHPSVLVLSWLLYLSSYFSGMLRYKNILAGKEDGLSKLVFSGFWRLSAFFAIFFIAILVIWVYLYIQKQLKKSNIIMAILVGISSLVTFGISIVLIESEKSHYSNYLYSEYGVTRASLELLVIVSLGSIIFLALVIFNKWKVLNLANFTVSKEQLIAFPFLGILLWYSLMLAFNVEGYLSYARSTYNQQFDNYKEIILLKDNTDQNAKIVLPPQSSKYPAISNPPIVRYFLFPRILISSNYVVDQKTAADFGRVIFITINKANESVWPSINRDQKIISFKEGINLNYSELKVIKHADGETVCEVVFLD